MRKNEHVFRWRSPSSRHFVASGVLCTQGTWDKQCAAHSFALCCSVLRAPISVSTLQANDISAVWLLFSWCMPSLLCQNAKPLKMKSATTPSWTHPMSHVECAHYPIYSPVIRPARSQVLLSPVCSAAFLLVCHLGVWAPLSLYLHISAVILSVHARNSSVILHGK